MKVVWASDRSWNGTGGAERADRSMLSRRPEDCDVTIVVPGFSEDEKGMEDLLTADRVIVSGILRFPRHEVAMLAAKQPVVWAHDVDTVGHPIHDLASDLILLTPLHQAFEMAGLYQHPAWSRPNIHLCPGWFDTTAWDSPVFEMPAEERGATALFAHRASWSKNLAGATAWAEKNDVKLRVMMGRAHEDVLAAMAESRYFVLLSHIVDPGPWSVMEAQLSGCELIVNELVGFYDFPRDVLRYNIDRQDQVFWSIVKGEQGESTE